MSQTRTDDEQADDELWEKARSLDTIRVYDQYLHTNTPFKKLHIIEAEKRFEQLEKQEKEKDESLWKQACSEDTLKAYQEYLGKDLFAKRYTSEVQQKIKALEAIEARAGVSKTESLAPTQPPHQSTNAVSQPSPGKWRRFALVGAALIFAYVIWASLGGDRKTQGEPGQEGEIAQLMQLAIEDIGNDRLGNPPGKNALEKYRRILAMQPEHPGALQGIKHIAARYLDMHKQAVAQGDANKAGMYLGRATSLDPDIVAAVQNPVDPPPLHLDLPLPSVDEPPPLVTGPSKRQQDESRCAALVEAGLSSLNQKPASDYERAIAMAMEARSIMPDCPGAAGLLKQASSQRDFFMAERLRKEREDSLNRDRCQVMVAQGRQAMQSGRYDRALRYAVNARNTYAQCPDVDLLEQGANTAIATAKQNANTEKLNKCVSLVNSGKDALLRRDYSKALRNATEANRLYPGCLGATELESNANEAICTQFVMKGREAFRAGQYNNAVTHSRRAINTYAHCPGAESLEQEALLAMNAAKDKADQENQERARVRCDALLDAGRDALSSNSYDQAIKNAKRAKQAYSQCPGADALEREAMEAKRKAMDSTVIF